MPLSKAVQTKFGVTANWWRIANTTRVNDDVNPVVNITVEGYSNASSRGNGSSPLVTMNIPAPASEIDAIAAATEVLRCQIWLRQNAASVLVSATEV